MDVLCLLCDSNENFVSVLTRSPLLSPPPPLFPQCEKKLTIAADNGPAKQGAGAPVDPAKAAKDLKENSAKQVEDAEEVRSKCVEGFKQLGQTNTKSCDEAFESTKAKIETSLTAAKTNLDAMSPAAAEGAGAGAVEGKVEAKLPAPEGKPSGAGSAESTAAAAGAARKFLR